MTEQILKPLTKQIVMKEIKIEVDLKDLNKRFHVFIIPKYYPNGGLHDLEMLCDTEEEYKYFIENICVDNGDRDVYYEILDTLEAKYFEYERLYVTKVTGFKNNGRK